MTGEILIIGVVVGLAGILLASGKLQVDVVALLVVLMLVLSGVLTAPEALSGFGNPVVIMVAGLFVISEMLARTGVAHYMGGWLVRHGRNKEMGLTLLLSAAVAVLGCFMSNTAVVAIFIPVVLNVASRTNLNASRLLLPLSYAGLVSGMLTLIASTPNLVVSAELDRAGFGPLEFFSFTPVGLAVLCVFAGYMLIIGRHLLPGGRVDPPKTVAHTIRDLLAEFDLLGMAQRLQVPVGSPLVGKTFAMSELGSRYHVRVVLLERASPLGPGIVTTSEVSQLRIRPGDVLVSLGSTEAIEQVVQDHDLRRLKVEEADRARWIREVGIAKVLVHPESRLIGSSIRQVGLRSNYGVQVLGVRRRGETMEEPLDQKLESGDEMLVVGGWKRIRQLQSDLHDFVVLALPLEIDQVAPAWQRAPAALAILAVMVALSALGLVPVVLAVIISALLAVLAGCLTMEQAYAAVHWRTVVLIAGMMSIASAMTKTGAVDLVVNQLIHAVGDAGPYVMMSGLFALTAGLCMVLSNTATAVLLAPIAIQTAEGLGVAPQAFAMTVAIAASAGYVMPISSPAVMLVVGPGKYRIIDFVKVGLPMLLLTAAVTIFLVPRLFPFAE